MEENRSAALSAEVRALTVYLRGAVSIPKDIEQLLEGHFGRIKGDLHDFGVSGFVGTDIFICGIDGVAVGIAHGGVDYAGDLSKRLFNSPEASSTKGCDLVHFTLRSSKYRERPDHNNAGDRKSV